MVAGTRYAQGVTEVIAQWTCRRLPVGSPYRVIWSQGTRRFNDDHGTIDYDLTGWGPSLANSDAAPFASGRYRMTFTVDGQVMLAGEIKVEGAAGFSTQPYFGQPVLTAHFDEAQGWPVEAALDVFVHGAVIVADQCAVR